MTIAIQVYYCKICSIPPEYCQFTPSAERCKNALSRDNPELYALIYESDLAAAALVTDVSEKLKLSTEAATEGGAEKTESSAPAPVEDSEDAEKKHQSRGGKGLLRDESVKLDKEALKRAKARITIKRTDRNKRKAVTHVKGFDLFGLDLKKVAKKFAGKYACGSSVVKDNAGKDEIDIQGDFVDDLLDYIPKEFPEIKRSQIDVLEK